MYSRYYRNAKSSGRRTSVAKYSHLGAVHEAGHILAGCLLQFPITSAATKAKGVSGFVDIEIPDEQGSLSLERWQEILQSTMVVCYAGTAAEYIVFGHLEKKYRNNDYSVANKYVKKYISTMLENDDEITEQDLHIGAEISAKEIVEKRRYFLDYIVSSLMKRGKMTTGELAIMRELNPLYDMFK